jgi:hypothetical protein
MLRVSDSRQVVHVNRAEPVRVLVPSRREAVAAFESILESLASMSSAEFSACSKDIEVLRVFLATR